MSDFVSQFRASNKQAMSMLDSSDEFSPRTATSSARGSKLPTPRLGMFEPTSPSWSEQYHPQPTTHTRPPALASPLSNQGSKTHLLRVDSTNKPQKKVDAPVLPGSAMRKAQEFEAQRKNSAISVERTGSSPSVSRTPSAGRGNTHTHTTDPATAASPDDPLSRLPEGASAQDMLAMFSQSSPPKHHNPSSPPTPAHPSSPPKRSPLGTRTIPEGEDSTLVAKLAARRKWEEGGNIAHSPQHTTPPVPVRQSKHPNGADKAHQQHPNGAGKAHQQHPNGAGKAHQQPGSEQDHHAHEHEQEHEHRGAMRVESAEGLQSYNLGGLMSVPRAPSDTSPPQGAGGVQPGGLSTDDAPSGGWGWGVHTHAHAHTHTHTHGQGMDLQRQPSSRVYGYQNLADGLETVVEASCPVTPHDLASTPNTCTNRSSTICCPVCVRPFENKGGIRAPKLLPVCLHTVCQQCAATFPGEVCSLDGACVPPPGCLAALPDDFLVLDTMNADAMRRGAVELLCDVCDEQDADRSTHYCNTCHQHLCAIHQAAHCRAKETKSHLVTAVETFYRSPPPPSSAPAPYCAVSGHERRRREMFCLICEVIVCDKCALEEHRDHVLGPHAEVIESAKQDMTNEMMACYAKGAQLTTASEQIAHRLESLTANTDVATREIEAMFDNALRALEHRKQELSQAARDIHAQKHLSLTQQRDGVLEARKRVLSAAGYAERLLSASCSASDLLSVKRHVCMGMSAAQRSKVPALEPVCDDVVEFRAVGEASLADAIHALGRVNAEKTRAPRVLVPRWDSNRKGQDVVLTNSEASATRVDHRGWGAVLGAQTLTKGRCVVNFRIDACSINTYVGVAFIDTRLNEGVTKRNSVLRENGELFVWGDKVAVVEGFRAGDFLRFDIDFVAKICLIIKNDDPRPLAAVGGFTGPLRPFVSFGSLNATVTLI